MFFCCFFVFLLFFTHFIFLCFSTCSRMSTVKWYTYFDVSRRNTYKKLLISHVVHRKKYFSSEIIVCVFLLFFCFFVIFHTFYFFVFFDMFPNEHGKMVYIFWCISTKTYKKLLISHVVHRKKYFSSEIIVCVFLLFFCFFVIFHTFYFFVFFDMFPNEHGKMVYIFSDVSRRNT